MRWIYVLVGLNALIWGAWFHFYNHDQPTPVGSYFGWWFDDLPLAFLFVSVVLPLLAILLGPGRNGIGRGAIRTVATVTLLAVLPYGCFSGGGI